METRGPVSPAQAAAALASVRRSRTRVAWAGYPRWYWVAAGAALAVLPFTTLPPKWLGLALTAAVAVVGVRLALAAGRARGVCEGWTSSAMRWQEVMLLYVPATAVMLAGAVLADVTWWFALVAAVAGFGLFAGTGLMMSARAARG